MNKLGTWTKLCGGCLSFVAIAVTTYHFQHNRLSGFQGARPAPVQAQSSPPQTFEQISYGIIPHPRSIIHRIKIPANPSLQIQPIIPETGLKKIDELASTSGLSAEGQSRIIAAINGGFFDPTNQQTTSFMIQDGNVVLDPNENARLINNPDLSRYMPQILNRSEFRRYRCQTSGREYARYAIAPRQQPAPPDCQLVDALGAGPALLPQQRSQAEAFLDASAGRDAIGSLTPNARSAIGLSADGSIFLIMAAQHPDLSEPSGLTLAELVTVMKDLGITNGLNLDGGSSSSLYYQGKTYYGRLDANQVAIERPVKSAIAVFQPK